MKQWLPRLWYASSPWLILLLPLSWIYSLLNALRSFAYRIGVFKTTHFQTPVIVVGNMTVGGTGKTPLVMHLAKQLIQAGYRPGIVSRGYGGHAPHYPCSVHATSNPQEVGDEALELFMNTAVPMVVDPNRPRAVATLLKNHSVNVVLSDDGLQHRALIPSLTIGVVDGKRRFGNGYCLPAGPNRESPMRWYELDIRVCNGIPQKDEWQMRLTPISFQQVQTAQCVPLTEFSGKTVHAVTGIGHPERFIQSLEQLNITVIPHLFPDHHAFVEQDFLFQDDFPIMMTGKDAVKCQGFAHHHWWQMVVAVECDPKIERAVIQHVAKMNQC